MLDELLKKLGGMPPEQYEKLAAEAVKATAGMPWIPSPGPQTEAYHCEADELFYGGQAGGGKSDLLIGCGLTAHTESLILRRVNDDAKDIAKRAKQIAGDGAGYNGQDKILSLGDRAIKFAGCQFEDDKERFKGRAKDFYGFDEIGDFSRSQYKFITTWNRSAKPGQRCRIIAAGNPPTRPEGLWIVQHWGAWLDKRHSRPAKPGELRWFTAGSNGEDIEVDGPGPHLIDGEEVLARSRTFIPARLSDNPYLGADYKARLDSISDPIMRAAYRDGIFLTALTDADYQVIPTAWVLAAQERWAARPPAGLAMTAMAMDPGGGGADNVAIAARYGGWYAPVVAVPGKEAATGNTQAGLVVAHRRDRCPVIVDVGGGYGNSSIERMQDNAIAAIPYNGAGASMGHTRDGSRKAFFNKRAETWWRFREALDPDQEGGSIIALPDDPELRADLTAPCLKADALKIKIEPKEDIKARLGRSPGKGDAVVMALSDGGKAVKREKFRERWDGDDAEQGGRGYGRPATANLGYAFLKKGR